MATLLLAAAGSAVGAGLGGTLLGVSGAVIGRAVGGAIGRVIDQKLLGGVSPTKETGPRLDSLDVMTSQSGNPMLDISGRIAVAGEVIWAAKLKEVTREESSTAGSGKRKQKVESTVFEYFASFAVSLGEGPAAHIGRIWADGEPADLSDMIAEGRLRFYPGSETQTPDPLIAAIEGSTPAYRGTAYVVFEDLPLTDYGNRVPQIKVEVWGRSGVMETLIRGVNLIPGSTEWGYMPEPVTKVERNADGDVIREIPENATRHAKVSDWSLSLDALRGILPAARTVSLVVAWFGTDLRAGLCDIEPRLEVADKDTSIAWSAGGLGRGDATVVSYVDGRPAYGSAPPDIAVIRAIRDLRARGHRVVLYPFVMMDVAAAQGLPDPSGTGTQRDYPWRGRIAPAAGGNVAADVAAFLGTAAVADFAVAGDAVTYSGPAAFRFRRFILHLAHLAKAAGGVDAMLIGSEMRGLTMAAASPGDYPFVAGLRTLAADVSAVLPSTQIGYAADWSEYHSDRPDGDVWFHLDPLWSDANIDFVGIDNYLPLADWRPGSAHADHDDLRGHTSPYSLDYLKGNVEGGEYWDWFYADAAARAAQDRTAITDGAFGEPWVYRQKAVRDWHGRAHHNRAGGVRSTSPTGWVPGSKPVWFTELGCPAVDMGANRPNVFSSATSSESDLPWFSNGLRDDFAQRQFLRAALEWWRDNGAGVVSLADIQVWCWDARLWPEFPQLSSQWSDGQDWALGHWLNGRAGAAPAAEAVTRRLTERHGLSAADFDVTACHGQADGYPGSAPTGFRDYFQPLEIGLGLQAHEASGRLVIEARASAITVPALDVDGMVDVEAGSPFTATRSALEDVAGEAVVKFRDGGADYATAAARAVISEGYETGIATADSPLVLDFERGNAAAERLLRTAADGRETIAFTAPRSAADIRPGVVLPVRIGTGPARPMMVERVTDGDAKQLEVRSFGRGGYAGSGGVFRLREGMAVRGAATALVRFLDLPLIAGMPGDEWDTHAAAHGDPWPGGAVVARSATAEGGYGSDVILPLRAVMGDTIAPLDAARAHVWTQGPLDVRMYSGSLVGRPDVDVLAGANTLALAHPGGWEIVQFREAELVTASVWRLSGLLRGQRGTEHLAASPLAAGAGVVMIGGAVTPLALTAAEAVRPFWFRSGAANRDPATHAVRFMQPGRVGQRPFAPAHLRTIPAAGGADISWVRRTRAAVATWPASGAEPAIGEQAERYRLEIGTPGSPVRIADLLTPGFSHTAAMRVTDGLALPIPFRVAQVSETYGPGTWAVSEIVE